MIAEDDPYRLVTCGSVVVAAAAACAGPGYEARRQDVRDSVGTADMEGFAPIEEVAPGWMQRS